MLKIRFVEEFPEYLGHKHRWVKMENGEERRRITRGCYRISTNTIYVIKTLPFMRKYITLFHEIGHWAIDRVLRRARYHFWYDLILNWHLPKNYKCYKEKAQALRVELPVTLSNGRKVKW